MLTHEGIVVVTNRRARLRVTCVTECMDVYSVAPHQLARSTPTKPAGCNLYVYAALCRFCQRHQTLDIGYPRPLCDWL